MHFFHVSPNVPRINNVNTGGSFHVHIHQSMVHVLLQKQDFRALSFTIKANSDFCDMHAIYTILLLRKTDRIKAIEFY